MGDAIARTLWRLFVSRRHLLEWTPAAQAAAAKRLDLQGFAVRMSGAFVLAAAALTLTLVFGHGGWPIATPFVVLWVISPAVARYASLPPPRIDAAAKISEAQSLGLRQIARRTWRFFETFVTADDNMLPPDNFQEDPTSRLPTQPRRPTSDRICFPSSVRVTSDGSARPILSIGWKRPLRR